VSTVRTYASMVTFAHTLFAMPFAAAAVVLALERPHVPLTVARALAMVGCMVAARTAAMAFNRYLDRSIDSENPRTQRREVPAGIVAPTTAVGLTIASSAVFVLLAGTLGRLPLILSLPVLVVLLGYSYTKRFTWASHLVLGVALALAPGGAWIAMGAEVEPAILALMTGVVTWVAGFDVIYSLQDEAFDRAHGLYSVPAAFGTSVAVIVSAALHVVTVSALAFAGIVLHRGPLYHGGVALIAVLLVWEHVIVGRGTRLERVGRAFFDVNGYVSAGYFVLTLLDGLAGR